MRIKTKKTDNDKKKKNKLHEYYNLDVKFENSHQQERYDDDTLIALKAG